MTPTKSKEGRRCSGEAPCPAVCLYCGVEIKEPIAKNGVVRKYCSKKCSTLDWQKKHGWRKSKKAFLEKGEPKQKKGTKKTCTICGRVFVKAVHNQKYCRNRCSRDNEYFVPVYAENWRAAKARYMLVAQIVKFKEDIKNG